MPKSSKKSTPKPSFDSTAMRAFMERTLSGFGPDKPNNDQRAQDLVYDAMQASTWEQRIRLARQALDLDPENAAAAPMVLINPEIACFGAAIETYEEGCLSIPGVYLNVVRPATVEVSYRDEMGRPQRVKADGLLARCIQHEMDHLEGVLFVDRVTDELSLNEGLLEKGFQRADVHSIR